MFQKSVRQAGGAALALRNDMIERRIGRARAGCLFAKAHQLTTSRAASPLSPMQYLPEARATTIFLGHRRVSLGYVSCRRGTRSGLGYKLFEKRGLDQYMSLIASHKGQGSQSRASCSVLGRSFWADRTYSAFNPPEFLIADRPQTDPVR